MHNKPTFILDKIDENVVTFQTAKWPNWLLANRNPWTDSRFSFQNSVFYRQPRADFDHHHTQKENLWIFLQSTGNIWPEDARHLWREKNEHQVLISRTDSMKKNAYFIQILIILNSIDVIWFSTYFEWRNPEMWGLLTFSGAAHRLNKMILNPPTLLNGRWKLQTAKKVREKAITAIFRLSRSEIRLYFRVRFATNSFPISNNSASDMNCWQTVHIIPVLIVYWEEINKIRLF